MSLDPDCPACDELAHSPDFDDHAYFETRQAQLEERYRSGGPGYGVIEVTAKLPAGRWSYPLVRMTLREQARLWAAASDGGDGTFMLLVDASDRATLEELRDVVDTSIRCVAQAAGLEGVEVLVSALGTDDGGEEVGAYVWSAFRMMLQESEWGRFLSRRSKRESDHKPEMRN